MIFPKTGFHFSDHARPKPWIDVWPLRTAPMTSAGTLVPDKGPAAKFTVSSSNESFARAANGQAGAAAPAKTVPPRRVMNFRRLMKASSDYSLAKTGTDGVVEGDGWLAGMRYVLRLNQSSNLLHQRRRRGERQFSMVRNSGNRRSEKIMLHKPACEKR